ncbi:N-6 DNA methylase [Candidatus Woesearchaeota archaeon]|nr:N-6 DNA methylase [Candidatus Woesearchaeota archaeon]
MVIEGTVVQSIKELLVKYNALQHREKEVEKRAEDFIRNIFEALGWKWLSDEVIPQHPVLKGRVDYCFKKKGDLKPLFYIEVKRFSNKLDDDGDIKQAVTYGKNSGTRFVILTNFIRWRIFNADYFDELNHAELFEFDLSGCVANKEYLDALMMFGRDAPSDTLDGYAKKHKKWKESAEIIDLLTETLVTVRKKLRKAVYEQNDYRFDTNEDKELRLQLCVQTIIDRIVFCRMLEDTGGDAEHRLSDILESWRSGDKRVQFYRDHLCAFFAKMNKVYDSSIFEASLAEGLTIKNEDFIPLVESFYIDQETQLPYRFDAIKTDILGRSYEMLLSESDTGKDRSGSSQKAKRKQHGIYYTPEFLIDHLVASTLGEKLKRCKSLSDSLKLRVVDPACGSGAFLVRALEEFKRWFLKNHPDEDLGQYIHDVISDCIYGIDLDPKAIQLTRLNLLLHAVIGPRRLPQVNAYNKNSLVWDSDDKNNPLILSRHLPLIAEMGGFDVVIGNPPWEKFKPDSQEFFEQFDQGFSKLPTKAAKPRMDEILKSRPQVRKQWEQKLVEYAAYSDYFMDNYQFQSEEAGGKHVSGDIDLYKLFTERAYALSNEGGMVGFVVPSGVYTDLGAKGLRGMLFENCTIKSMYCFENRKGIFADVDSRYKFVLLTFEKSGKTKQFPCAFFLHSADDLERAIVHPTVIDVEFIKKASPTSWGVLEIKTPLDYKIVQKMLQHPPLGENIFGKWNIAMSCGFHMTNDSHLFRKPNAVLNGLPLLEGKNMHQFAHRWVENPDYQWVVSEQDVLNAVKPEKRYHTGYWIAYRLIARSTDERTMISALVPPGYVCGNSLAIVKTPNHQTLCYLQGILNSFVLDYLLRQKVSANVNMFYFKELPIPRGDSGKEFTTIGRKSAQLSSVTKEFSSLKKELEIEGVTNENDRAQLRAEIDAAVAKLYGITKEEMAHILKQFPLVEGSVKVRTLSQM